jgi:hypothetical protein
MKWLEYILARGTQTEIRQDELAEQIRQERGRVSEKITNVVEPQLHYLDNITRAVQADLKKGL